MLRKLAFGLLALTLLSMPISFSAYGASDYKNCIRFMNPFTYAGEARGDELNFSNGGQIGKAYNGPHSGGIYGGSAMGYLPFDIQPDGKALPHKGIESYEMSKDKKTETFTYEMDIFAGNRLLPGEKPDPSKFNQTKEKEFTVVINRDDNGNIVSIVQNNSVSDEEIANHNKWVNAWYEYTYSKEFKDEAKKSGLEAAKKKGETPFMAPLGTITHFKTVDDGKTQTCVPTGQETKWLLEADKGGFQYLTTNFDTRLCQELNEMLKDETVNSDVKACYRASTNNKFAGLFKKYAESKLFPNFQVGFAGLAGTPAGGLGGYGGGFNYPGLSALNFSVDAQLGGYYTEPFRKPSGEPAIYNLPHIAKAAQLVNQCRGLGLGPFLGKHFWQDDSEDFVFKVGGETKSE